MEPHCELPKLTFIERFMAQHSAELIYTPQDIAQRNIRDTITVGFGELEAYAVIGNTLDLSKEKRKIPRGLYVVEAKKSGSVMVTDENGKSCVTITDENHPYTIIRQRSGSSAFGWLDK